MLSKENWRMQSWSCYQTPLNSSVAIKKTMPTKYAEVDFLKPWLSKVIIVVHFTHKICSTKEQKYSRVCLAQNQEWHMIVLFKLSSLLFHTCRQNLTRLSIWYLLWELLERGCFHPLFITHNIPTELPFTRLECTPWLLEIHVFTTCHHLIQHYTRSTRADTTCIPTIYH